MPDTKNLLDRISRLENELERRSKILDQVRGAIIVTDFKKQIVLWSKGAEEIFGYASGEVIGRKIDLFCEPAFEGDIDEKLKRDGMWEGEAMMKTKSGKEILTLVSLSLLFDQEGKASGVLGYGLDITERKEAEDRFKAIISSANDAIIMICGDGFVRVWNKAAERIFGYTAEEIMGLRLSEFIIPEQYRDRHREGVRRFKETGKTVNAGKTLELTALRKGGDEFHIEISYAKHVELKGERHAVAIVRDISARKEMEEKLHAAKEQAEEATKLKDNFVSIVAHDLKSPFNSMLGFMKLISSDEKEPLSENQSKLIGRAIKNGENLVEMIDDLLNISRLQTGKLTLEKSFYKAVMAVGNVTSGLNHLAREKGINLVNEIPGDMRLYADMNLHTQVIQNLVSNAIKFCGQGDTITIFNPGDEKMTVAVRDTGLGIDAKILPNLFRHDIKTTLKGSAGEKGTGLGLPFANDIMAAHGGRLEVASKPGEGAVFYASLPVIRPAVLLVDDNETDRYLYIKGLEKLDIDIFEAQNGEEALKIARERNVHLIITDISMPVMDGFELLGRLREDEDTGSIPVIMLTSGSDPDARDNAFNAGARDFVTKPVDLNDFLPRARRFLG